MTSYKIEKVRCSNRKCARYNKKMIAEYDHKNLICPECKKILKEVKK